MSQFISPSRQGTRGYPSIAKLADRIHLAEFPEEYAHMNDSHADAQGRSPTRRKTP